MDTRKLDINTNTGTEPKNLQDRFQDQKAVFHSKNGTISEKMREFFKKYTIPEMLENDKKNGISNSNTTKPDLLKIFDGGLPL